jgi:hypothetical protein
MCGTHALWMAVTGVYSVHNLAVFELFELIIRALLTVHERSDMRSLDTATQALFEEEAHNILFGNYWPGEAYMRAASIVLGRNIVIHPVVSTSEKSLFCNAGYVLPYSAGNDTKPPIHLTYEPISDACEERQGHHRLLLPQTTYSFRRGENNSELIRVLKQRFIDSLFNRSPTFAVSSSYKTHRKREFVVVEDDEEEVMDAIDAGVSDGTISELTYSDSEVDLTRGKTSSLRYSESEVDLPHDISHTRSSDEDDYLELSRNSLPDKLVVTIEGNSSRFVFQHIKLRFRPGSTLENPEYQILAVSSVRSDLVAVGGEIVDQARPFEGVQIPTTKRFRSGQRFKHALAENVCNSAADYIKMRDEGIFVTVPDELFLDGVDISTMLRTAIGCFAQHACPSHATSELAWFVIDVTNNVDSYIPYLKSTACTFDASADNPIEITFNYRTDVKHSHIGCASCPPTQSRMRRKSAYKKKSKPNNHERQLARMSPGQMSDIERKFATEQQKIPGLMHKKDRHKHRRHLDIDRFRAEWFTFENCCGIDHMTKLDQNKDVTGSQFKKMWMLDPVQVYAKRISFCGVLSKQKLKQKIFEYLQKYRSTPVSYGNRHFRERIYEFASDTSTQKFCACCASTLLGVSATTFGRCARLVRNHKQSNSVHANTGKTSKNQKRQFVLQVIEAMKRIDYIHSQPVPNRKKRVLPFVGPGDLAMFIHTKFHLPVEASTVSHILAHDEYFKNVECTGDVKKNAFMRCTTCDGFTHSLKHANADKQQDIERNKLNHLYQIEFDRSIYYKHNQKALDNPNTYASLNFDGFDQAKTRLPHTIGYDTHAAQKRMEVHVSGFVSRGFSQPLILYLSTPHYPNCANLTVTMLKDYLEKQADFGRFEASLRRIVAKKDQEAIAAKNKELHEKFSTRKNDAMVVDLTELNAEMAVEPTIDASHTMTTCPMCGCKSVDNVGHLREIHSEEVHLTDSEDGFFCRPDTMAVRMSMFESLYILQNKILRRNGEAYLWQRDYRTMLLAMIATATANQRRGRYMTEVHRLINGGYPSVDSLIFYANWKQTSIRIFSTDTHKRSKVIFKQLITPDIAGDSDKKEINLVLYRQSTKWAGRSICDFYLPLIKADEFAHFQGVCTSMSTPSEDEINREALKMIAEADIGEFADGILEAESGGDDTSLKSRYPNFFDLKLTQQERIEFATNLKRVTRKPDILDFVTPASQDAVLADDEQQASKRLTASMAHVKSATKWPSVLYVSTDNCAKDNKNYTLVNFYALLVCFGHFDKIKLNFPQVGHSHNWIDQIFSCIARFLTRSAAFTIDAMMKAFHYAWSNLIHTDVKRAYSFKVEEMFDVTDWLAKLAKPIVGIREGYVYKIVPEYLKDENGEDDVLVYIYARLTSLTYYPNLRGAFRDEPSLDSKYESKQLLMKRNEVLRKWREKEVPEDPSILLRRAMEDPTYSELEKTIRDVQEKVPNVSEKIGWMDQWSAWFKEQKQKDADEDRMNDACDDCAPLNTARDEALTAFDLVRAVDEDDAEFKARKRALRQSENAVRNHRKNQHRRIATGWWSKNRIPKATTYYDEEEKLEQEERPTVDYGSRRTQHGFVVSNRKGDILRAGKGLENDAIAKQVICLNDIVVLMADETDSTYHQYPCFWIGQVVGFHTAVEQIENSTTVSLNEDLLETELKGTHGKVVRYQVQWFERYWTKRDTADWWLSKPSKSESQDAMAVETSNDNDEGDNDEGDDDEDTGDMAKCRTMCSWKYIPSVDFNGRIPRSWWKSYGNRRPVKGDNAPFRCSNWGVELVDKSSIIHVATSDCLNKSTFIESKSPRFEDVPEDEMTDDEVDNDDSNEFDVPKAQLMQLAKRMKVTIPNKIKKDEAAIRQLLTEAQRQSAQKKKAKEKGGYKTFALSKKMCEDIQLAYQAQWKAQWVAFGYQKKVKA